MMFLKSALTLFLATNASAFFVSPGPRHFVSRHVALSDPTTSSEVQPEGEDKVSMEVAAPEDAESANNGKRVFQGERHTIYVGNLPYGITTQEVQDMFAEHCEVKYVSLPRNADTDQIKGFAFIDVGTEDDIAKAVDALNGLQVGERPLRVSKSLDKDQIRSKKPARDDKNKLFVGNLPFKATREDIRDLFSEFGEILDVFIPVDSVGEPRGFAFVTCSEADLEAVREGTNGAELLGRTLSVNLPLKPGEKEQKKTTGPSDRQRKTKLFVGNLSFYTSGDTLSEVFEEFGVVHDCYIPQDVERGTSRGFGFVTMDEDAANEAVEALNGCELDGRIIAVNEAQAKRKQRREYQGDDSDDFHA